MSFDPRRMADAAPDLLLQLLDQAAESGDVDERQLADTLGLTPGALRRALAEPAGLSAEHAVLVGGALGVDAGVIRTLRRRGGASGLAESPTSDGAPGAPPAPALGTVALLAAIVDGVADDAAGRALRVAVLDVAAGAARAAGRALPPAAHELRARVLRASIVADAPAAADLESDAACVADVAAVVAELQRADPGYDGIFAPLADDAVDAMLRRFGVVTHLVAELPAGTRFVLTPPLVGRMRVLRSATASPDQRRVVARAALAHVVAGHVRDDAPLGSPAPAREAAVAEGVALADLVPFWQVADLRRKGRLGWQGLREHVGAVARGLTRDWDGARAMRRGEERVALFRERAV